MILLPFLAAAQQPPKAPAPTPDPNFMKWKVYLDVLTQEARNVTDDRRPYAMTDLAAAYLEFDRDKAKRLLFSAVDEAYKFRQVDKNKYTPMLNYILRTSARNLGEISGEMAARLRKLIAENNKDKNEQDKDLLEPESEVLRLGGDDAARRAELAKSLAPKGLKEGPSVMTLILSLAQEDNQALADDVYRTYLQRASADPTIPIGALIQLAGYSIGYGEYYHNVGGGWSMGTMGSTVLKPDPQLAPQCFALLYQRIKAAIDAAGEGATTGLAEVQPILFILQLLMPDVEARAPALLPGWQLLAQQAVIGLTPDQIKAANDRVAGTLRSRARYFSPNGPPPDLEAETDAMLTDIDKVIGTCQRDLIYSRAVLNLLEKNPKRALELIGKIDDKTRAATLTDILYSRRLDKELKNGDLDVAAGLVEKISSPMVKTAAWANLASAYFKKGLKADGGRAADAGIKLIEKIEANDRAGAYFGMAVLLSPPDPGESGVMLDKGIKNLNKLDPLDTWPTRSTLEIELSCPNSGKSVSSWGADFSNSDIFGAVTKLVKRDLDAINSATDGITDKSTRVRAQAIIARAGLAKYKLKK